MFALSLCLFKAACEETCSLFALKQSFLHYKLFSFMLSAFLNYLLFYWLEENNTNNTDFYINNAYVLNLNSCTDNCNQAYSNW